MEWPAELMGFRSKLEEPLRRLAPDYGLTDAAVDGILDEVLELQDAGFLRVLHAGDPRTGAEAKDGAWLLQAAHNLLRCRQAGVPHVSHKAGVHRERGKHGPPARAGADA